MRKILIVLAALAVSCAWPPWNPGPTPTPTPTPEPTPPYTEECQALLDQGLPWCDKVEPPMTCGDCVHNPSDDPRHCQKADDCPEPPPSCPEQCPDGQVCTDPEVGCVPEPVDPPPPGDCPWGTPTARSLEAQGVRVEIRPKKEGRRAFGVTPLAAFGKDYYCQPGLWPEACAAQRNFGPVAPDGHPDRVMCEKQFLEQSCATVSVTGGAEHMSLDPWIVQGGVNQNHPRNVEVCEQKRFEDDPSWVKEPYQGRLYIVRGQMSWTTAHGNGQVCAEAKGGAGKRCVGFTEP